jgi:hypothetical protein
MAHDVRDTWSNRPIEKLGHARLSSSTFLLTRLVAECRNVMLSSSDQFDLIE